MSDQFEELEEDENDLLPTTEVISEACPYCGKLDAFVERADFSSAYVFCNSCSAKGPVASQESDSEEEPGANDAIRHWNRRAPAQGEQAVGGDDDHMIQIQDLISQLEAIHDRFGNTCVYIRRQGMGWGAVALNRRDDDKQNGVFDLQAQHDRDMHARLEQIGRLKADREEAWRKCRDAEGSRDAASAACDSMRIERDQMRDALQKIADAPAWGAPERWETTPAEVRQLARAALATEASDDG